MFKAYKLCTLGLSYWGLEKTILFQMLSIENCNKEKLLVFRLRDCESDSSLKYPIVGRI